MRHKFIMIRTTSKWSEIFLLIAICTKEEIRYGFLDRIKIKVLLLIVLNFSNLLDLYFNHEFFTVKLSYIFTFTYALSFILSSGSTPNNVPNFANARESVLKINAAIEFMLSKSIWISYIWRSLRIVNLRLFITEEDIGFIPIILANTIYIYWKGADYWSEDKIWFFLKTLLDLDRHIWTELYRKS